LMTISFISSHVICSRMKKGLIQSITRSNHEWWRFWSPSNIESSRLWIVANQ
jgi:hypothetical protein